MVGRLLRRKEAGIFLALVAMMALIGLFKPEFLSGENRYLLSRQVAHTAILALGVFFVILTGGIDLSIGSIVGLSGFLCAMAMVDWSLHPVAAVALGLWVGVSLGAINGAIVSYLGVTPFIVTLGMLGMARGAVYVLKHGEPIFNIPRSFVSLVQMNVYGLPMAFLVMVAVAATAHVVLVHTVFGRRVYALGGNEEATRLSGINTRRVKFLVYVISGLLSAVTGVLFVARFGSAQADAGAGMELDAIAAAVIGGASLMGGEGSVLGVLIGAAIMGVVKSGLVFMKVETYWQDLVIGCVIVAAAIFDVWRSRRKRAA
ncbi:MAG: ABC transporter permease [Candidatus Sumerlaeia bacterium]|nr:ABC transporter permease [Candidatus Sumerlaeia bacterium]